MHRDRDAVVTRPYVEARATNDADDRVVDGDGEWLPGGDVDRLVMKQFECVCGAWCRPSGGTTPSRSGARSASSPRAASRRKRRKRACLNESVGCRYLVRRSKSVT